MATTKKITELKKANTVGVSDLMVLSQSGEKEATSTTVGALVDKVAAQISDGALLEHLAGLSKQKQILAQALNDKGVNVTSTDTLDKMAAEIKDLDIVGAQDKVVCEFCSQFDTTNSTLSTRIASNQAVALHGHNAIISVSTSGVFGIYKLAVDGTLKQIASCDCSDFVPTPSEKRYARFGCSKNEEHLAWFDSKLKKIILFHMDWETNTLTSLFTYTTTTANLGTNGNSESTSTSYPYLLGVVPASDGSKVCILSSNKTLHIHATIVDVATQTEVTNIGNTANAVNNNAKICYGFWHWDIETGLIQGGTGYYPLFEMTLDLSGDIPFLSFGGYRITNLGNYTASCYGMPYFLWDKGVMLQLATTEKASAKLHTKSGVYGTLWLRDIETGRVLDSVEIEIDKVLITKNSSSSNTSFYVGCSVSVSSSYSPIVVKKDGKILVGFGNYMRFEFDEENKKLIPYKHNGAKDANGRYICFPAAPSGSMNSYMPANYIYCDENPDLVFTAMSEQETYASWVETSNAIWYYEEPCVLGLILNRNGKRRVMYDYFSYTQYKSGAYAEKDEVAVLELAQEG